MGTLKEKAILDDLRNKLPNKKITTKTQPSGKWHIRLSSDGDVEKFFKKYGYEIEESDINLSGMYATYIIKSELGQAFFVNQTRNNSRIKSKELSPEKFNVTGNILTDKDIIKRVEKVIPKLPYSQGIKDLLLELLQISNNKGNNFSVVVADIKPAELRTISTDYGEICCALWSIKNLNFPKITFPSAINEPLVDFYGIKGKKRFPVSVKSGGGSATSIKNISLLIEEKIKDKNFNKTFSGEEKKLLELLIEMNNLPIMDGFLNAHLKYKTKAVIELKRVTGIKGELTVIKLMKWLKSKKSNQLKSDLEIFYKELNSNIKEETWKRFDQKTLTKDGIGVLIGPMGHSLIHMLNGKKASQILTKVAKEVYLIQMNVDVKNKRLLFKYDEFSNFKFKFRWQGGAPNPNRNRIGFSAITK